MALRTIRVQGDPVLEKICKPVKELTPRTRELIEDMLDTMYEANGVGLAAPQVGILKRIVVIDVGEGPVVMVNPVILETSGEQTGDEGCLSIPGKAGQVTRPNYVKVHAFDENMEEYEIEGTDFSLHSAWNAMAAIRHLFYATGSVRTTIRCHRWILQERLCMCGHMRRNIRWIRTGS